MARGMSLDDFKNALSSDATKENEELKKENLKLRNKLKCIQKNEIPKLNESIESYKNHCKALGNRCFIFTGGTFCNHCMVDCCEHSITGADMEAVAEYMMKK